MEPLQSFIEQIKAAISDGKSEEEIFQFLHPHLEEGPHRIGRLHGRKFHAGRYDPA